MSQEFLKVTFHSGAQKISAYLQNYFSDYFSLKKQIAGWIFEERQQPHCEIRIFWIDESGDEIELINQNDLSVFYAKCSDRQHLHIAPVTLAGEEPTAAASKPSVTFSESASKTDQIPPVDSSYDFAVHDHVECDACLMAPIVGFRYKCIQCPNYDLCQNCETKHIHSEHMMVRMPNNNCPNIIEAYVTGRASGRKHGKRSKTSCPFVRHGMSVVIDDDIENRNSAGGENAEQSSANRKEHHYGRKHRRHHRNNFFSHLYEMMHDLAEGGGPDAAAHAMGESSISSKTTTSTTGPQKTTTTTTTTSNGTGFGKEENPIAAAAAAVAQIAAKQAHEAATKAIADGFGNKDNPIAAAAASAAQMAAKQAHEAASNANANGFGKEENPIAAAAAAVAQIAAKQAHEAVSKTIADGFGNEDNPIAAAAASAAQMAAKQAHEAASKANATGFGNKENPMSGAAAAIAQMAAKQAHEAAAKAALTAVKAAHENVLKKNKNMPQNTTTSDAASAATNNKREKEKINEKIDATTSPNDLEPQPDSVPVIPTPSLESFVQFLDPNFMKTGVQILNNFSDMFAKMLDPMEESGSAKNQNNANLRKNSTTSTKSSSSINSIGDAKNIDEEKSLEKNETQEKTEENKQSDSDISHVEIYDLGSDSENESVSETFVKLYAPKKGDIVAPTSAKPSTAFTSAQTAPPQSLEKSNVMDYAQLGAALKSHIAKETQKDSIKSAETTAEPIEKANEAIDTITSTVSSNASVVTASTPSTNFNVAAPTKPEEKRAVLVYHADQRINNAVHAMMAMGFSNEGAWLTQLLESVNGNISDALDLMSAAQLNGNR